MKGYYQELGFKPILNVKLADGSEMLKISRQGFLNDVGSRFLARPGFSWMKNMKWDVKRSNELFKKYLYQSCVANLKSV